MDIAFLILEIIGTIAFAISGSIVAINKKMNILGVAILGLTTAIGGGVARDVILGYLPPASFRTSRNALIAISVGIVVFIPLIRKFVVKSSEHHSKTLLICDSIGLAIFTILGINATINYGFGNYYFLLIFMGVITAVGGGVMRDVLACEKPYIFVKGFYAIASIIGAIIYILLYNFVNVIVAMIISPLLIITLRICSSHFHWNLPTA